jgi:hypothetical protein
VPGLTEEPDDLLGVRVVRDGDCDVDVTSEARSVLAETARALTRPSGGRPSQDLGDGLRRRRAGSQQRSWHRGVDRGVAADRTRPLDARRGARF